MSITNEEEMTHVSTPGATGGEGVHPPPYSEANGSQLYLTKTTVESDEPSEMKPALERVERESNDGRRCIQHYKFQFIS